MSTSNEDYWKSVRALFQTAVSLPADQRESYLDEHCEGDTELRQEVMALLAADATANTIGGIVGDAAKSSLGRPAEEQVDRRLGNYRLVRVLGEGGMGTVYLAARVDQQYQQQVAIKILNSYRPSRELISRFRTERQILANLDHPNIARLVDGGESDDGLPFLVMEYVEGEPITDYCIRQKLPVRDRLTLFLRVCRAVEHAHRNLVIHRDIKPSNILVTPDGDIKLLDFGIAKLMSPESLGATVAVTMDGSRLLTPGHASPEQVRGDAITTATDIYSLGILLYEMLTTRFPYDFDNKSALDIQRMICTTDPERPSTRVEQVGAAITEPPVRGLARQLRGDLDNIVMVAIRKDAVRRYATVRGLSDDIESYLRNRPVKARPENFTYIAQKFVSRNRWAVAAGAAFIATTAALTITYTAALAEQRDRAQLQADRANEVATFMSQLFSEADPRTNLGKPLTANQMLERGADRVVNELGDQPELQAALLVTMAESYHTQYQQKSVFALLDPILPVLTQKLGREHPDIILLSMRYAYALAKVNDLAAGLKLFEENYDVVAGKYGAKSHLAGRHLLTIGSFRSKLASVGDTESVFLEAIEILRAHGDEAGSTLVHALMEYGVFLRNHDRIDEEEHHLLEALAIQESRVGRMHPDYTSVLNNIGNHYNRRGQFLEAVGYFEELVETERTLYGDEGIPYGVALMNYSNVLLSLDRNEESLATLDTGLEIFKQHKADNGTRYAYALENKANIFRKLKRYEEAEPLYLEVLEVMEDNYTREHYEYAFSEANYAGLLNSMERWDEAQPFFQHAASVYEQAVGATNSQTLWMNIRIASTYRYLRNYAAGLSVGVPALAALRETVSDTHPQLLDAMYLIGLLHRDNGDFASADALFIEALENNQRTDNPTALAVKIEPGFAESLARQGRAEEAAEMLRKRRDALQADDSPNQLHLERIDNALESLVEK